MNDQESAVSSTLEDGDASLDLAVALRRSEERFHTLIERSYEAMLGGAEYATSATINEMFAVKRGKDGYVEYFANDPDDLKRGENYAEEYCQNSGVVLFRWPYPEAGAVAKAALIPTKLYDVIEVQDPVSLAVARGVYEHRFAATRPRLVI